MMHSLARMLPDSISVLSIQRVPPDFHARYTAQRKVYHYYVRIGNKVDPFTRWHRGTVLGPIHLTAMRYALQLVHTYVMWEFGVKQMHCQPRRAAALEASFAGQGRIHYLVPCFLVCCHALLILHQRLYAAHAVCFNCCAGKLLSCWWASMTSHILPAKGTQIQILSRLSTVLMCCKMPMAMSSK